MLAFDVTATAAHRHDEIAVTFSAVKQQVIEVHHPARSAPSNQSGMEYLVLLAPLRVDGNPAMLKPTRNATKPVKGQQNTFFPSGISTRDRLSESHLIDPASRARQFEEFIGADRRYAKSLLV